MKPRFSEVDHLLAEVIVLQWNFMMDEGRCCKSVSKVIRRISDVLKQDFEGELGQRPLGTKKMKNVKVHPWIHAEKTQWFWHANNMFGCEIAIACLYQHKVAP